MKRYLDHRAPIEERIADLLARMTTEEKILQTDQFFTFDFCRISPEGRVLEIDWDNMRSSMHGMSVGSVQLRGASPVIANALQHYAVEETRLGIPFLFSEEALHGFFEENATCFPQQIALAGTFEPELGKKMGHCIAAEARAYGVHETFSPVMDLTRDPRYGRVEESYGEDTYLCGEFARETVKGMQGESLREPDTVAAEPKHYVGYGTPVGGLNCAPSALGRHDVFAWCLPVFEQAYVEGGAWNAMCSYNSIDGQPVASDRELLTDVLRGTYGMRGFVRTDLTAVSRLYGSHFTAETKPEAIRQGMEAGVDLQLYDFTHEEWMEGIKELLLDGKMRMETLDQACARVLRLKFELGLFEHPYVQEGLYEKTANCREHQETALEIARRSICLLKNQDRLLPLTGERKKIAVVGPGAAEPALGDYCTNFKKSHMVSVLDGIRKLAGQDVEISYEKGCSYLGEKIVPFHPGWLESEDGTPGLTGRYYHGWNMEGEPVVTRVDPMIQFNWIYAKPHPALDANCFSVVWTGKVKGLETFSGCIGISGQDSMRLYVDGELVIDTWGKNSQQELLVDFAFEQGREYRIRLEFRNDARGARVIFGYNRGRENQDAAIKLVQEADAAVVCLGDSVETCGENLDRAELILPGKQLEFLKKLWETGTPIVLVLQNGRPLSLTWEQEHIPAILECWYPGEKGGEAIAEVLFGKTAPSGRLPMSFPKTTGQVPCNYNRLPGGGIRYVETDWEPLYPFGYGLSYTTFAYSDLSIENSEKSAAEVENGAVIRVSFTVTNTGNQSGEEVAQLYIRDCYASTVKPLKELAGFEKISLEPGESRRIRLLLGKRQLRTLNRNYEWHVEPGEFQVMVGDNAADVLLEGKFRLK
ncbi:MAG: glycoside hydrolase family 3 C-terminal domain-containing protein [Fusicatenibacter sp.]|nr:glycoside hydrolase family 3 C-terminal domain-containing protein [Lachnospiraceae bacterium]MDY2936687.1 glycoside hydrolase family 3 C-terminal domain-containing protein [Fusicatenibacter sp.]